MLAPQSTLAVRIKFMGDLPAVIGQRCLEIAMPAGSTVRVLLASVSNTYGEAFAARVFSSPAKLHHYILIFVDGEHVATRRALDAQLGDGEVDVVMLPTFGGG
jgi:hypothetical protein